MIILFRYAFIKRQHLKQHYIVKINNTSIVLPHLTERLIPINTQWDNAKLSRVFSANGNDIILWIWYFCLLWQIIIRYEKMAAIMLKTLWNAFLKQGVLIEISLKFVGKSPLHNYLAQVQEWLRIEQGITWTTWLEAFVQYLFIHPV